MVNAVDLVNYQNRTFDTSSTFKQNMDYFVYKVSQSAHPWSLVLSFGQSSFFSSSHFLSNYTDN